jgi:hypothetical protein
LAVKHGVERFKRHVRVENPGSDSSIVVVKTK